MSADVANQHSSDPPGCTRRDVIDVASLFITLERLTVHPDVKSRHHKARPCRVVSTPHFHTGHSFVGEFGHGAWLRGRSASVEVCRKLEGQKWKDRVIVRESLSFQQERCCQYRTDGKDNRQAADDSLTSPSSEILHEFELSGSFIPGHGRQVPEGGSFGNGRALKTLFPI